MRLIIALRRNQPATHGMLQKELILDSRNPATQNAKLLLKITISNLREIWSNMVLFKFGVAKFDIRQLPRPKMKFKEDFLSIVNFTLPFFKALSQDR